MKKGVKYVIGGATGLAVIGGVAILIPVALVAAAEIAAGVAADAESLQPNYLRLSQAEREKLERQSK